MFLKIILFYLNIHTLTNTEIPFPTNSIIQNPQENHSPQPQIPHAEENHNYSPVTSRLLPATLSGCQSHLSAAANATASGRDSVPPPVQKPASVKQSRTPTRLERAPKHRSRNPIESDCSREGSDFI